jgi:hypothetical protein
MQSVFCFRKRAMSSLLKHLANDPAFRELWNQIPANIRLEFSPDTLMSPRVLVARLDEAGIPIAFGTLERLRSVGGGPIFTKFGKAVLYRWGDALVWALDKLRPLRTSTSDAMPEDAAGTLSTPTRWSMPAKRRASTTDPDNDSNALPPAG